MEAKLFADLELKIDEWVKSHCEEKDWPDIYIGNLTVNKMTSAAAAVFDGIEEAQEYERINR